MSRAELNRFLEDARTRPLLLSDLRGHLGDRQSALRWASEQGYQLGEEEIDELRRSEAELSDDELDQAAGGDWTPAPPPPPPESNTGGSGGGGG